MKNKGYTILMALELTSIGIKYGGSDINPFQHSTPTVLLFLTAACCHILASTDQTNWPTIFIFNVFGVVGCEALMWILIAPEFFWWYIIKVPLLLVYLYLNCNQIKELIPDTTPLLVTLCFNYNQINELIRGFWPLIFSPSFVSKHSSPSSSSSSSSSSSPFSSFLLLSHPQLHRHFPLYDCTLGTWRNISLSLSDSSLQLCNLLAKPSRKIQYPSFSLHLEHLTFVITPTGYTIFVLCSEAATNCAFVYDSNVRTWKRFDGFGPVLDDNHHQKGVFFKGGLYFATLKPFSVVIFDLGSGRWEKPIGGLPSQLTFVRLVSDGEGKLYLVGGVWNNGISRSIKLWELGGDENWVEVQSLPDLMCKKDLELLGFKEDLALASQVSLFASQM
ncbi:hypothetical protein V8G54_007062 [Vigna mungo]|uniref:F-box/kelch-repeat protein n=1 Tax=Vigna mungo TaxID=3915 RepID=A0AAQ3P138_VIGMU